MKPIALIVLLLALAGGGYFLFVKPGPEQTSDEVDQNVPQLGGNDKEDPDTNLSAPDEPKRQIPRRDVGASRVTQKDTQKDFMQGVEGQVTSSVGGVVRDAEVYLLYGVAPQDMISQLAMVGQGGRLKPKVAAEGKTDGSGAFKLGSPPTSGAASFELRIKAANHVVHKQPIRVVENKWEKLGLIKLDKGRQLQGIVRDAVTKAAVPNAIVRIKVPSANFLMPTPGFEDGIEARTDTSGRYSLGGLPLGPLELTALAKGYGTFSRTDLVFAENEQTRTEDIELPKGFEIAGWVIDSESNPVSNARVEATPFSHSLPSGYAYTDKDGFYTLIGLGEGDYIVSAEAPGYVRNERKPIKAGSKEINIPLETQGKIRVKVLSKKGRLISRYSIELKRFFPENPEHLGKSDVPRTEVRSPKNGEFLLTGVNPGNYVVQVDAAQYAKTYSKNFQVVEGQTEPPLVEVYMNEGATITGVATDAGGMPIKGATVTTLEDSYQDNPLMQMFRPLMTVKITERTVVTDNKGRFTLNKLNPAKYQLRVDHPDYTRTYKKGIELKDGQKFDTGFVQLKQGGIVRGAVLGPRGRPVVAAKVTVSSVGGEPGTLPVFETVFTDDKGKFKLTRPLPAGRYELQATRTDHANPLMQLADIQNSRTEITLRRGMQPVTIRIKPSK